MGFFSSITCMQAKPMGNVSYEGRKGRFGRSLERILQYGSRKSSAVTTSEAQNIGNDNKVKVTQREERPKALHIDIGTAEDGVSIP